MSADIADNAIIYSISTQKLIELMDMSLSKAAESIGVSETHFKTICRHNNIVQWPFRRVQALRRSEYITLSCISQLDSTEPTRPRMEYMLAGIRAAIDETKLAVFAPDVSGPRKRLMVSPATLSLPSIVEPPRDVSASVPAITAAPTPESSSADTDLGTHGESIRASNDASSCGPGESVTWAASLTSSSMHTSSPSSAGASATEQPADREKEAVRRLPPTDGSSGTKRPFSSFKRSLMTMWSEEPRLAPLGTTTVSQHVSKGSRAARNKKTWSILSSVSGATAAANLHAACLRHTRPHSKASIDNDNKSASIELENSNSDTTYSVNKPTAHTSSTDATSNSTTATASANGCVADTLTPSHGDHTGVKTEVKSITYIPGTVRLAPLVMEPIEFRCPNHDKVPLIDVDINSNLSLSTAGVAPETFAYFIGVSKAIHLQSHSTVSWPDACSEPMVCFPSLLHAAACSNAAGRHPGIFTELGQYLAPYAMSVGEVHDEYVDGGGRTRSISISSSSSSGGIHSSYLTALLGGGGTSLSHNSFSDLHLLSNSSRSHTSSHTYTSTRTNTDDGTSISPVDIQSNGSLSTAIPSNITNSSSSNSSGSSMIDGHVSYSQCKIDSSDSLTQPQLPHTYHHAIYEHIIMV